MPKFAKNYKLWVINQADRNIDRGGSKPLLREPFWELGQTKPSQIS